MKKLIAFTAICIRAFLSKAQNKLTLQASIKGMEAGQWVYVNPMGNSLQKDSVQTSAGSFQMTLSIPEGQGDAYIVRIGQKYADNSMLIAYLDNGTVEINGEGPLFKEAKLSGTSAVKDYRDAKDFTGKDPVLKEPP